MSEFITCIMVTHAAAQRLPLLRMTLHDFARQTHANREMVVVIDASDDRAAAPVLQTIAGAGLPNVRPLVAGRRMSLGALRNLSWAEARGDLVCVWDDDDRHHPTRLAEQSAAMAHAAEPVCYLQELLHYFVQDRRIYRVNFRPAPDPVAVNTLMCRRELKLRYPESGPESQLGEDTALFRAIRADASFHALSDQPHLFIYANHGANTCSDAHHRHLIDQMAASQGLLRRNEAALRAGLAAFDFGSRPVIVTGRNGDAFMLEGAQSNATAIDSL